MKVGNDFSEDRMDTLNGAGQDASNDLSDEDGKTYDILDDPNQESCFGPGNDPNDSAFFGTEAQESTNG
jgi:hypothetical protein